MKCVVIISMRPRNIKKIYQEQKHKDVDTFFRIGDWKYNSNGGFWNIH